MCPVLVRPHAVHHVGMSDSEATVLAANQAFYAAFEARDLGAMDAVWEPSDRVLCTHPGWPTLRGRDVVMQSWDGLFRGPQRLQFILTNETVAVQGDTAWVALDENLLDQGPGGTVAALNVFVAAGDRWLMVAHHGSSVVM
jgi:ketosteroid isomerase-like protein